jgi:hypothetical protein
MPPRLVDVFHPGDAVQILMDDERGEGWRGGTVVALQHPGVWVRTEEGGLWFVTNSRHIRPASGSQLTGQA